MNVRFRINTVYTSEHAIINDTSTLQRNTSQSYTKELSVLITLGSNIIDSYQHSFSENKY